MKSVKYVCRKQQNNFLFFSTKIEQNKNQVQNCSSHGRMKILIACQILAMHTHTHKMQRISSHRPSILSFRSLVFFFNYHSTTTKIVGKKSHRAKWIFYTDWCGLCVCAWMDERIFAGIVNEWIGQISIHVHCTVHRYAIYMHSHSKRTQN